MTKNQSTIQPLESYRLVKYSRPVTCYLCETENTWDSEYCTHCWTPMSLGRQYQETGVAPKIISVLGAAGAGKTVYLGMLMDMLSRGRGGTSLVVQGARSLTLQQTTMKALARCEFPEKTPSEPDRWNWVHCRCTAGPKAQPMELLMPDMAGDTLFEEIEHPHSHRGIRSLLKASIGALVLVDGMTLSEGRPDSDFFAMKLVTLLNELGTDEHADLSAEKTDGRLSQWPNRPLAMVVSKSDRCDTALDSCERLLETQASGLWQYCRAHFPICEFFGVSVAGRCATRESMTEGRALVPLRIEPTGIVEPFLWLLDQCVAKQPKRGTMQRFFDFLAKHERPKKGGSK